MTGWEKSIITPIDALLAPNQLMWKEKWGLIRCEWIVGPDHKITSPVPPDLSDVIESASRLCCSECGRWDGWAYNNETEYTKITTKSVRGWIYTLCQTCRKKMEDEDQGIHSSGTSD